MSAITQEAIHSSIKKSKEKTEANLRVQLAYLYRIFDYYSWCDLIVTHLSVRIPDEQAILINPFGLSFKEITPDNLVKIDFEGNVLESKSGLPNNKNGSTVHRAIYRAKPEINCILHTHSHFGVVVASLEQELMLLDQIGMMFLGKVGYHDFEKLFINDDKQQALLEDIQDNYCMILKNHGLLTVGNSIAEAFWFHYYLETTCKNQVLAMSTGGKIHHASEEAVKKTAASYDNWRDMDSALLFEAAKRQVGDMQIFVKK
jgi:ribulose-5-phosphate 4-epimerase/fuculose-1-phosphate aldolase